MSGRGELLVVKRGKPPLEGRWTLPGGRLEPGEDGRAAALRELREEAGLIAHRGLFLTSHFFDGEGFSYSTSIFLITEYSGAVLAGDDAESAQWIPTERLREANSAFSLISTALTALDDLPGDQLVVLVNDDNEPVGVRLKSDVHTQDTPLHRAFSCLILDRSGRLLLTRRAQTKATWPGVWTGSCCGHPLPGQNELQAVTKRVDYELGIGVDDIQIAMNEFRYRAVDSSGIVENEICPVYLAICEGAPKPKASEVIEYSWSFPDRLIYVADQCPALLSPWLVLQLQSPPIQSALAIASRRLS
jgi:isopentenyl-diphosphate delta-isomerase